MLQTASKPVSGPPARPFLKWAGGKTQLLSELVARMPEAFNRYFEPFIGGGALFFSLQPENAYISDINADLINAYQVIRSDVELLIQDLKQHRYQKDYFYKIRNVDRTGSYQEWTNIQKASRLIFLNKTCFNGLYRVNSQGQFNAPFGTYKNPNIVDEVNLRACSRALQNVEINIAPFDDVLHQAQPGDFIYFDPPYVPLNETANFTAYSSNGFNQNMQYQLREICEELDSRGIKFMASNSAAPLIQKLYRDFHVDFVDATRSINSNGSRRGKIKEVVITNYDVYR